VDRRDDSLGIAAAETVGLAALPHLFDPGDPLNLSMQARNTGTVPLTGTAILRIEDGDGGPIQTFQQEFGGLAPRESKPSMLYGIPPATRRIPIASSAMRSTRGRAQARRS
jgi:hypothetical protein